MSKRWSSQKRFLTAVLDICFGMTLIAFWGCPSLITGFWEALEDLPGIHTYQSSVKRFTVWEYWYYSACYVNYCAQLCSHYHCAPALRGWQNCPCLPHYHLWFSHGTWSTSVKSMKVTSSIVSKTELQKFRSPGLRQTNKQPTNKPTTININFLQNKWKHNAPGLHIKEENFYQVKAVNGEEISGEKITKENEMRNVIEVYL